MNCCTHVLPVVVFRWSGVDCVHWLLLGRIDMIFPTWQRVMCEGCILAIGVQCSWQVGILVCSWTFGEGECMDLNACESPLFSTDQDYHDHATLHVKSTSFV